MRLIKTTTGLVVAFGFDIGMGLPDMHRISWRNPKCPELDGWNDFERFIDPEFVREIDGSLIAYQPGLCIEMTYIGEPMVWSFALLEPT